MLTGVDFSHGSWHMRYDYGQWQKRYYLMIILFLLGSSDGLFGKSEGPKKLLYQTFSKINTKF